MSKTERIIRAKSKQSNFISSQEKYDKNNWKFENTQRNYTNPNSYYPKKYFSKPKNKYPSTYNSKNNFYQSGNYNKFKKNYQNYYINTDSNYYYNQTYNKGKGYFKPDNLRNSNYSNDWRYSLNSNEISKYLDFYNENNNYSELDNEINNEFEEENENDDEKQGFNIINNFKIVNNYFIISNEEYKKSKIVYSNEYIIQFKKWKISQESKLLNDIVINHINQMNNFIIEKPKENEYNKKSYYNQKYNYSKKNSFPNYSTEIEKRDSLENLNKWGRKDVSNEIKLAEKYKEKLDELKKKDPIKFDLTELLNILTVDNYEEIKNLIYDKISSIIEYQDKFLDVLFQKAINEKAFVNLYAKLCKELDNSLPQRMENKQNDGKTNKKDPSVFRNKLLDKCREIFKIDNNTKINEYIKETDPYEREIKLKKFILGNVNFIGELIRNKILSRKNVYGCINNLFKRFEKEGGDRQLKLINLEGIVILIDKFGTLMNSQLIKINEIELRDFEKKIDDYIEKLELIQSKENIPGFIKYKIINLIEKKKANWKETIFEKNIHAKGKDEIRKEYEESQKSTQSSKISQEEINEKIKIDLNNWKDSIEDGEDIKNYTWEIITDLYNNHCTLSEFLEGFIENSIDFVKNKNNLNYANLYISELLEYYSDKISIDEKNNLCQKTLTLISQIYYYSLDNKLITDVFSNILYQLNLNCLMNYDKIGDLNDLSIENIKELFYVFKKISEIDNNEYVSPIFKSFKFVKDNIKDFNNIYIE